MGIDELTYCNKERSQRLEARVRDPSARKHLMFAAWTPKGYDWVYKAIHAPEGYMAVRASTKTTLYRGVTTISCVGMLSSIEMGTPRC